MRRDASSTDRSGRGPSIERREYARRRRRLIEEAGEDCAIIVPAAPIARRNRDIEYPYRPDSDFFYLTGFPEPDSVALMLPGRSAGEYLLFCREHEPYEERMHGPRAGLDGACDRYGADDAFPIDDIDEILPRLLEDRPRIWYSMGEYPAFDARMLGWLERLRTRPADPSELVDLHYRVHEMRLYKSQAEVRMIRRAVELTAGAHRRAMAACRPGLAEYEVEAEILYVLHRAGCRSPAYPCIVAAGGNACRPHYTANAGTLRDGELVLVDAGAEYGFYAADVTRTWPVGGRFSEAQRSLYELVLDAQRAAIGEVRPGRSWQAPHAAAAEVLTEGLFSLGVVRAGGNDVMNRLCAYPTGHWLGLDVHDVADYRVGGEPRELEPGMVMTVEPGLYIDPEESGVASRWRGIGIRVEDVVLVTRDGVEVLSSSIPKSAEDLEKVVGSGA
ncbi:MAG: aminopeptidase P N-terminal domain-containing protein [Immundisolibacterales bacterium]|nr:aminopeptidase P N-terminal domain-containing protein [Immundisolibacterales bacterium]